MISYARADFIPSNKIACMNVRRRKKLFRFTGEHGYIYDYQRRGFFAPHLIREYAFRRWLNR